MADFDVLTVALANKNLVEAAAGTGKTYSIAIMVLRWILETRNKIDSVIAVTFTNNATAELKERILNFLETALLYYLEPEDCGDETIRTVCDNHDKGEAVRKLKAAINDFDTASIFTIHGFCQKLIREHAFELGIDFNMKLAEDADPAKDAATAFFREKISNFAGLDESGKKLLEKKDFREKLSKEQLADFISTSGIGIENTEITIAGNDAAANELTGIYKDFAEEAPEIVKRNREKTNTMGYDDILLILYEVLKKNDSTAQSLREIMKERYSFVLIDEFQDTDPHQYFIFKELFFSDKHTVFFIGDPKQSIYAFRNADIYNVYNEAKKDVDNTYGMTKNFRSSSSAVKAVNEVFDTEPRIFSDDSPVKYKPVSAAKKPEEYLLEMNGDPVEGILVKELPVRVGSSRELSKGKLLEMAIGHIIQTIHEMTKTGSSFKINEKNEGAVSARAVKFSDIAILTATNDEALEVCEKLKNADIDAAVEADSGKGLYIFSSEEALALQKLIAAAFTKGLAEFKALLLTFFYNKTIEDIAGENTAVTDLHEKFLSYFDEWEKRGFYAAFSKFTEDTETLKNIAGNGERTVGVLRQLAEIIHKRECEEGFSVSGTKDWFDNKIKSESRGAEEENIRPEGGKKECVRIMTLHKSKGLEFNIVFFPFTVRASKITKDPRWMTQHTKVNNVYKKEIKLFLKDDVTDGTDEAIEEIRRIYVGITRAKYLTVCYTQNAKKSLEPTSLFKKEHPQFVGDAPDFTDSATQRSTGDTAATETVLRPPEKAERQIRAEWAVSSYTRINSKGQSEDTNSDDDNDDTDNSDGRQGQEKTSDENKVPLADFPSGPEAGIVLHAIFEKAGFKDDNTTLIESILKKKMNFGGEELKKAVSAVSKCVNNVLSAPIFANGKSLSDVQEDDKITEMKFFITIENGNLQKKALSKIIRENYKTDELDEGTVKPGLLKGSIDLVAKIDGKYYIIDWKSNNLGDSFADYGRGNITEEMKKHNYYLQFMLYLAAFDKYMAGVDNTYSYDKNFGGVRYVFLRGVQAGKCDTGIFEEMPEERELRKIQRLLEEQV